MDVGNSAARCWVRFGEDGSHGAWVRTYPCKPGAKAYPGWHAFGFPWWEPDETDSFTGPGFTREFAKRSNKFPDAAPGVHFHGKPEWYEFGLPESAFALSGDALPPRDCEPFVALDVQDVSSDTLIADYPDCSTLQFDESTRIGVEVGRTLAQQVVRWRGCLVGDGVSSPWGGIFTLLFPGAMVSITGPNTVSVALPGGGGAWQSWEVVSVTADDTIAPHPRGLLYLLDSSTGPLTLTFPAYDDVDTGDWMALKRVSPPASDVTLAEGPDLPQSIEGSGLAADWFPSQYDGFILVAEKGPEGIDWHIVADRTAPPSGSGTLTIGATPVSGGTDGQLLRISPSGTLDSITYLDGGTFP